MRDKCLFSWWKKRGDPYSLYADDTAIFLEKVSDLPLVIETIFLVGNYTGLCLNLSKTIAFAMHGRFCKVAGVEINSTPVKYLGEHLGLGDLTEMNFQQALKKAQNNLQSWNKRQISLFALILVAKTFVASIFVHILNSVFVSSHQIHLIQQLLNDCVWQGCTKVRQAVVCAPVEEGGLNMMYVKNLVHRLRVKWFHRICADYGSSWSKFIWSDLTALIPHQLLQGLWSVSESILKQLPPFYAGVVQSYAHVNNLYNLYYNSIDTHTLPQNLWCGKLFSHIDWD